MCKSLILLGFFAMFSPVLVLADSATDLSSRDKKFIEEAASGGMFEVQLGQFASVHSNNSEIKELGQHMDTDHSKANEELRALAKSKGVDLSGVMSSSDQKSLEKLENYDADKFDKEYATAMVKDHENDISAFEKEAKDGDNADVKAFAEKTLPTLRHHLEMAKAIHDKM